MKVLFCHDGPIRIDNDGKYYGIAHNNDLFSRYFSIGNKVETAIRVEKLHTNKDRYSNIDIENFSVYKINNPSNLKGLLNRRKINEQIHKAVKESDYIVARLPSFIGNIAIKYAKKMNKPYLTEVVACPWDALWNHSFKGKIVAPFMFLKTRNLVRNSSYVIYVTNEFLQRRYPTNGVNIACSNVVIKNIDEKVLDKRINKIKSKPMNEKIIIGTTAAIDVRYKGQQYVIEALGKMKEQGNTNFEYQLVGAGDQKYLRSIAKKYDVENQVVFLGPKKHEDVFKWLDTIDIYTQPSRQEGLPRALVEAMSRAVPAFGANTAGIPELLDSEYIFPNTRKNIDEICRLLLSFDKEIMKKYAVYNFEKSKLYIEGDLNQKRETFYKIFKKSAYD